jgi:membrane-bound lytic murein transglycosylase B
VPQTSAANCKKNALPWAIKKSKNQKIKKSKKNTHKRTAFNQEGFMRFFSARCGYVWILIAGMSMVSVARANYLDNEEVKAFVSTLVTQYAFDKDWLNAKLAQAEKKDAIISAMSRPAEKVLEWEAYRKIFLTEDRISKGKEFLLTHKSTFDRMEKQFGVPREIVAAIIGVETRYGQHKGNYRVIDALATLGFDYPPRSKFFRGELEHFFLLTREQGFDPLELKGSYAGAMGYGQFISSSYRNFAIDFDGDGIVDILTNPVDAIGSVANYFIRHKWIRGEPVVASVSVTGTDWEPLVQKSLNHDKKVADFTAAGVVLKEKFDPQASARLMVLNGENGKEYWLSLRNFYAITRYNHSEMYALAVYQLSQAFRL